MKHSTFLLLLGTLFLTFGYTTESGEGSAKIHLSGDLLIRNIPGESITLYSVANPSDVEELGSIGVVGNHDIATSGTWLYADRDRDLQVYDIAPRACRA